MRPGTFYYLNKGELNMLSHTLFEAVCEIEGYEKDMADVYGEYRDHIACGGKSMSALQRQGR